MDSLNTGFEIYRFHRGLSVVRFKNSDKVVGYVNLHPDENAWFFIVRAFASDFYHTEMEAINDLVRYAVSTGFESNLKKLGLENNEKFDKK